MPTNNKLDLGNLSDEDKDTIFNIGLLKLVEIMYEGPDSVEKLKKNLPVIIEHTGLSDEKIWETYTFAINTAIEMGKPRKREIVGFRKN